MKSISAAAARKRLRKVIDMAQSSPVCIQRRGKDVAIVMSPDEFRRMSDAAHGKVNPAVARRHAESTTRWAEVYRALGQ